MNKIVLVAGATGNLGLKIVKALSTKNVEVRALIRPNCALEKSRLLEQSGARIYTTREWDIDELKTACEDVTCVVSALAGLREVVVDAQKTLLDAAIAAGVPRFIPSDYSLDFTRFPPGENRNLDLRREFHQYLNKCSIASTSIFNGAFSELLTNEMPMILFKKRLILYWGSADHKLGFTTMDNTAEYTAHAALDDQTPRHLRIAGDFISAREVSKVMGKLTGQKYRLIRTGGQTLLGLIIKIARKLAPADKELYPAWQGMQYMHNMIDERSKISQLDNGRYQGMQWESVKNVLANHLRQGSSAIK